MTKTSPTDRRADAIRTVSETFVHGIDHADAERIDELCEAIAALSPLGRTDRWKQALTGWIAMVRETPENRHWALIQGAIFTAHQA